MSATVILGNVFTCDRRVPRAAAVGIEHGRIRAVGGEEEVRSALGRDVTVIDAGSRTVLPGLIDPHNHLLATAESLASVNARFPVVADPAGLVSAVADAAERTPDGRWIRAFGMDHAKYPGERLPTRAELDDATSVHPVVVYHVSGHWALVNFAALAARGITDDVPDPPGGSFERDEAGRLTGLCRDTAMDLILPVSVDIGCHGPNFHTEAPLGDLVALLGPACQEYLRAGLTTVCDPQVTRREMSAYREARLQGMLALRTVCMPLSNQIDELDAIGLAGPFGDEWLRIGAMKLYADGTLIGGTAWFTEPYGREGEFTGTTYWRPEQLAELVSRAHAGGWQVGIHTQGDAAMQMTLDAIGGALREHPRHDTRHRIEHCGYPTPEQIGQIAELGIIPVNQPTFLFDSGDEFLRRLGERAERLQPIREELESGVLPVLSSDSFVASLRPLDTIANAVRRETRDGRPIGADQRMTVEEAVHAHTIDAAASLRMEHLVGSLEPGKLGDVTVLDGDLFSVQPDAIAAMPVWRTVLHGDVVHAADPS
jgi:predicted amidohydrolase YtcJ